LDGGDPEEGEERGYPLTDIYIEHKKKGGKHMLKVLKNVTLTLLISSALTCGGLAQNGDQWMPQKDRKKEPERPIEKKKEDRGGRDRGEKKDKKPDGAVFLD
jgi:hypothetical protein